MNASQSCSHDHGCVLEVARQRRLKFESDQSNSLCTYERMYYSSVYVHPHISSARKTTVCTLKMCVKLPS